MATRFRRFDSMVGFQSGNPYWTLLRIFVDMTESMGKCWEDAYDDTGTDGGDINNDNARKIHAIDCVTEVFGEWMAIRLSPRDDMYFTPPPRMD